MKDFGKKKFSATMKVEEAIDASEFLGSLVDIDGISYEIIEDLGDSVVISGNGIERTVLKTDLIDESDDGLIDQVEIVITEPTLIGTGADQILVEPGDFVTVVSEAVYKKQKAMAEKAKAKK